MGGWDGSEACVGGVEPGVCARAEPILDRLVDEADSRRGAHATIRRLR